MSNQAGKKLFSLRDSFKSQTSTTALANKKTTAWDQAVGEKGKKWGQIGKILASRAATLSPPFFAHAHFFFLFPPLRSLLRG